MLKIHLVLIIVTCIIFVCAYNYDYYSDGKDNQPLTYHYGKFRPRVVEDEYFSDDIDNQLLSDGYGKFRFRMIEGVIPETFKYSFLAAIHYQSGNDFTQFCTGTLIAMQYVLTSMRCLDNAANMLQMGIKSRTLLSKLKVTVGSQYKTPAMQLSSGPSSSKAPLVQTFSVIDYAASEILILKLDREAKFEVFPPVTLINHDPVVDEVLHIAAFGSDTMPNSSYTIGNVTVLRTHWPNNNKFLTGDFNRGVNSFDLGCPVFRHTGYGSVVIGVFVDAQNDVINITDYDTPVTSSLGVFLRLGMYFPLIQEFTDGKAKCKKEPKKYIFYRPIIGNKRINGDPAAAIRSGQFVPNQAIQNSLAAIYIEFEGMLKPFCTGTLIAFQYVLTSYGCLAYASEELDVQYYEAAAELLRVSVGSSRGHNGRTVNVLDYFESGDILILKINRTRSDFINDSPMLITGYQPPVDDYLDIVYFKGQSSLTLSYATGSVAVRTSNWRNNETFLTGDFNRDDIDGADGCPALMKYKRLRYQVGVLINSQSGYITMDQYDNHTVGYNLGVFVKLEPYCDFIANITRGEATCRIINRKIKLSEGTSEAVRQPISNGGHSKFRLCNVLSQKCLYTSVELNKIQFGP